MFIDLNLERTGEPYIIFPKPPTEKLDRRPLPTAPIARRGVSNAVAYADRIAVGKPLVQTFKNPIVGFVAKGTYSLKHYLIGYFGDLPLRELSAFAIQVWLNGLADEKNYSESVVGSCFSNIRAITHLARKQKFLADDPGEDVTMPLTKPVEKLVMNVEQIVSLLGAITDLHDLCLMLVGIFSGPRASEVFGFQ